MNAKVKVTRIDPTNWYVDMKDPSLQLMFYGEDLDGVEVTTDYLGARVDSVVHLPIRFSPLISRCFSSYSTFLVALPLASLSVMTPGRASRKLR